MLPSRKPAPAGQVLRKMYHFFGARDAFFHFVAKTPHRQVARPLLRCRVVQPTALALTCYEGD